MKLRVGAGVASVFLGMAGAAAAQTPSAAPVAPAHVAAVEVAAPTPDLGLQSLTLTAKAQIQVDEGKLIVTADYALAVDRPGTVRFDRTPLDLPLLAPTVRGVVVDRGSLPPTAQTIETEVQGGVTVERVQGALQVRGFVDPANPGAVRIRYPVAFEDSSLALGFRGATGKSTLEVAFGYLPPVRLQLEVDRGARVSRFEEGRERVVGAFVSQPLRQGEHVTIQISDLPAAAQGPRRLLMILGALLALGAAVVVGQGAMARSRRGVARQDAA